MNKKKVLIIVAVVIVIALIIFLLWAYRDKIFGKATNNATASGVFPLMMGSIGPEVGALQVYLQGKGQPMPISCGAGTCDGIWGNETQNAVHAVFGMTTNSITEATYKSLGI